MNSTSVAPGVSKTANDLVVAFLMTHQGSTTDEIMAGINRSRKGVLRVCNANVLITEVARKGKGKAWRIDSQTAVEGTRFVSTVEAKNKYDEGAIANLARLEGVPIDQQVNDVKRVMVKVLEKLDSLPKARHVAIGLQAGHVTDSNAAIMFWGKTLDDLESIKTASIFLGLYADQYLDHPAARSVTEWWSIFPKENSNG